MSMEDSAAETNAEERSKLIRQMIYAACAVGLLLLILFFFNRFSRPDEPQVSPTFTTPVPVPPKNSPPEPLPNVAPDVPDIPPENQDGLPPPEPPPDNASASTQTTPPVTTAPPQEAPAQASSSTTSQTDSTAHPVRPPAQTPQQASKPVTPLLPPRPQAPPRPSVEDEPEGSAPPTIAPPSGLQANAVIIPRPQPLSTGFLVRIGVFSDARYAEELQAKLLLNGIPATLETRVQVGPFKTQAEAKAAKAKLKSLGLEGVVVPPLPGKH